MATLRQLLNEKAKVFDSVDSFLEGIKATERSIYARMLAILRSFARPDGTLENDSTNLQTLNLISKEVTQKIAQSTLQRKLSKFLTNFDKIEDINTETYNLILSGNFRKVGLSAEKQILIDQITDAITGQASLNAQYTHPIRQLLYTSVTRRVTFKEARENLEKFVLGNNQKLGRLSSYVGQVTTDALNGYDGAVQDVIRDANGLTHFRYVGSIIRTSRENCIDMINGTGNFKEFSLGRGVYRVSDLEKIIKKADKGKGSGFNDNVTPETFAQIRWGYNCRHSVIYFNYDEPDQKEKIDGFSNVLIG